MMLCDALCGYGYIGSISWLRNSEKLTAQPIVYINIAGSNCISQAEVERRIDPYLAGAKIELLDSASFPPKRSLSQARLP